MRNTNGCASGLYPAHMPILSKRSITLAIMASMSSASSVVSGSISASITGSATSSAFLSNSSLVSPTKVQVVPSPTIPSQSISSTSTARPTASPGHPAAPPSSMSSASSKPNATKPGMPSESTGKDVVETPTTTGTQGKPTGSTSSSKPASTGSHTSSPPVTKSTSKATPPGPASPTSNPTPQTSTKVSVIHVTPSVTRTSTITDAPISTFSTPVAVSVTNSTDGKVLLSTPPAVTVLSTSTDASGDFVTYTHVIANPTSYRSDVTSSGFLSNHGAVAGVFVSVGVVVVTVSVFLAICIRQRRRINRRRRWLEGMQPQHIPDPFEDPTETREIRSVDGLGPLGGHFNDSRQEITRSRSRASQRPSVIRKPVPELMPEERHTFDPERLGYMNIQRTVNRDSILMSRASFAPSTPSIYPASLPDEDNSDGQEGTAGHVSDSQQSTHYLVPPPPRPPRSHLRLSSVRPGQIYPSPVTSFTTTAASPDQPSSPESENGYMKGARHPILARRTLLGVQPRTSPDLDHSTLAL